MIETQKKFRPIFKIAREINKTWSKVHPYAKPYLDAMLLIQNIEDDYYQDTATDVVMRFLGNAQTWRGEDARRIKAELKEQLKTMGL